MASSTHASNVVPHLNVGVRDFSTESRNSFFCFADYRAFGGKAYLYVFVGNVFFILSSGNYEYSTSFYCPNASVKVFIVSSLLQSTAGGQRPNCRQYGLLELGTIFRADYRPWSSSKGNHVKPPLPLIADRGKLHGHLVNSGPAFEHPTVRGHRPRRIMCQVSSYHSLLADRNLAVGNANMVSCSGPSFTTVRGQS